MDEQQEVSTPTEKGKRVTATFFWGEQEGPAGKTLFSAQPEEFEIKGFSIKGVSLVFKRDHSAPEMVLYRAEIPPDFFDKRPE